MREFKFRVWDKLDRCYKPLAGASFGGQRSKFCGFKYVQLYAPDNIRYDWQVRGEEPMGFEALNGGCSNYKLTDSVDADRLVFEQYTGLKDKNGKEIYEGDLVEQFVCGVRQFKGKKCGRSTIWQVRWHQSECCFELHRIKGALFGDSLLTDDAEYEVIGNIHESPELLEVKNED